MLAEYDDSSLITLYTRGEELISQEHDGQKSYYLYDGFDSVRMLTDSEGVVTDTYTFDAFGNLTASTGETENNYLYRGEQYDSFTGLYYLRARYMNPTTGTFISMDEYAGSVFEPVSLHKYLYANANPVTYCDPTGYSAMAADQCVAMAGLAILCTMVVANYDGIINAISFMLTEIYDAFAIATDTIAEWCEGLLNGSTTSSSLGRDVADSEIPDEGNNDSPNEQGDNDDSSDDYPDYPGDDPSKSPGDDWEWRGKGTPSDGKGNWTNPKTGESLHPDLKHPEPYGPHWDYKNPSGDWYRIFPDGTIMPK